MTVESPPTVTARPADSAARHFTRAAGYYEKHAGIQRRIAEKVISELRATVFSARRILEIGCGTGYLTAQLADLYPQAEIVAVDPVVESIELGRKKFSANNSGQLNIKFVPADFREYRPTEQFDLIVSSSALQWISPLDNTLKRITELLTPGGILVCSVIVAGTFYELHTSRLEAAPAKPPRRALPTVDEIENGCVAAGLEEITSCPLTYVSVFSDPCGMIEYARALGFTGGDLSCSHAPLSRSELRSLVEIYSRRFNTGSAQFRELERSIEIVQEPAEIPRSRFRKIAAQEGIPVYAATTAALITAIKPA